MIAERVPRHGTPMAPPTNEERWDAVKELYRAERNREHQKAATVAKELQQ